MGDSTKAEAGWGARVGEQIRGGLWRGAGGRFASGPAIAEELEVDLEILNALDNLLKMDPIDEIPADYKVTDEQVAELQKMGLVDEKGIPNSNAKELAKAIQAGDMDKAKQILKDAKAGAKKPGRGGGGKKKPKKPVKKPEPEKPIAEQIGVPQVVLSQLAALAISGMGADALGLSGRALAKLQSMGFVDADGMPTANGKALIAALIAGDVAKAAAIVRRAAQKKPGGQGAPEKMIGGFKSLGADGWIGFFSNVFLDRDVRPDAPKGERFELDALKEYAEWVNNDKGNLPALLFWHLPTVELGRANDIAVAGPFIVAKGTWADGDVGQKAQAFFAENGDGWAMSHGFVYKPEDRVEGVYKRFRTKEVSVLPREWAANPITLFSKGGNMDSLSNLVKQLASLLGITEAEAEKLATDGLAQNKAASEASDVITAVKAEGVDDGGDTEDVPEVQDEDVDDEPEVQDDDLALALADALIEVQEGEAKRAKLEGDLKAVVELLAKTEKRLSALEEDIKARKSLLPRAVQDALSSVRNSAGDGAGIVAQKEVEADQQAQADELKAARVPDASKDPIGWTWHKAFYREDE